MSLKTQLALLVIIPLLCAAGAIGGLVHTYQVASLVARGSDSSARILNELNDFILFLQEPPAGSGRPAQYHLQATRNRIDTLSKPAPPLFDHPDERRYIEILTAAPTILGNQFEQARRAGGAMLTSRHAALLTQELKQLQQAASGLATFYNTTLHNAREQNNRLNLALLAIALAWPTLFSILFYRTVVSPLKQLKEACAAVTRGLLGYRISLKAPGEPGQLIFAFNKMVESRQKVEEAARESEARLKNIFDHLPMLTVCLDRNGAVSYCNDFFLKTCGRERPELIGKNWFDLCLPDPEPVRQLFSQMVATGEPVPHCESELLTRQGTRRTVIWNSVVERDSDGVITGTTSIGYDVTEQREAQKKQLQSQQALHDLLDSTSDALLLVDREGDILAANRAYAHLLNSSVEKLIGGNLFRLLPADLAQTRRNQVAEVMSRRHPVEFHDTHRLRQLANHLMPVLATDGTVKAVAICATDITDATQAAHDQQKNTQELQRTTDELRQKNEELTIQLAAQTLKLSELTTALNEARQQAEVASRAKNEFLANISHEIRTPLNAVLGLTHLALQTDLNSKQQEYLKVISNSAHQLLETMNDLLDFSKLESGRLKLEQTTFSLGEVVDRVIGLVNGPAKEKGLDLKPVISPGVPDWLVGDPLRLEQVLFHLLTNAIKFTERGQVTLRISSDSESTAYDPIVLTFSVQDSGIGMDEQTMARLYQPFTQADSSATRLHGGTGLGLAICKQLVEMMGGSLTAESTPGNGSTFTFTARFESAARKQKTAATPKRQLSTHPAHNLRGYRLLVVEDQPINQQIARELLESYGAIVETARNGCEAVDIVRDHGDHLNGILMDIQMPEMDGYEATRQIRELYSAHKLPIIAMTAHAFDEERKRCLAAGMNDHLPKPLDPLMLYQLLCRHIGTTAPLANGEHTLPDGQDVITLPDSLPGIDLPALLERVNHNQALVVRLIRLFAHEHRSIAHDIGQRIQESDLAAAARLAHGLKGVAGNLAASAAQKLATQLEEALKKNDSAAAQSLLAPFEKALNEVFNAAELVDGLSLTAVPSPEETESDNDLGNLMRHLYLLLQTHDLNTAQPAEQLARLLTESADQKPIAALLAAIERLDYHEAQHQLEQLATQHAIQLREEFL